MTFCLANDLGRCYLADELLIVIITISIFNFVLNIGVFCHIAVAATVKRGFHVPNSIS